MNEIRLLKLVLRDFQGGNFVFQPDGKDSYVFGQNASGKTRLVSAFTFLLFSKDALGRSDFEIKNLDEKGEAAHGLEHSVEAELSVNGKKTILKKVYKEKWSKKRGNVQREFTGHTTEYFVDGVPMQEKLYIEYIIDVTGDESRFRLLTSPTTFPALHWQKQRQLLLEICGDLSDADVIASNDKLSPLVAILGKHTLDDHRKIVTARRSAINKEMEKIPVRIDEVRRGIPDVTGIDRKSSETEVQRFETALNDAKLRLQGVNTGGNIATLTTKLSGLNADLRKMEDAHRSGSLSTLNQLNQQISEIEAKVNVSRRRIDTSDGDLKWKDGGLQTLEKIDLPKLREKWMAIDAETFKDTISDTCPACGQSLPSERVQEARKKALATFNESKANRLGEINQKGKDLKEQKDRLQGEIDALKKEREILSLNLLETKTKLKTLTEECDALKKSSEDFSSLSHWSEIFGEVEAYEEEIKAEREGKIHDIKKIQEEIYELQDNLRYAKDKADLFIRKEQGEKRIEELKLEEKKLSAEYEELESELYLIELFIKMKVSMLTDRINGKFEIVRFKLFNQLINGGIEDCCEITVNGIPFNGGLNNSARIQAGCDIIRTMQQHFGMRAPVFCDNRESVSEIPEMGCQLISLVVSPEDETLTVWNSVEEHEADLQQKKIEKRTGGIAKR